MNPHVISWMNVETSNPDYDPDNKQKFKKKILAEGDSWFSLRGIPTSNLLTELEFDDQIIIVSCAQPGDTIRKMGNMLKNDGFKRMTSSRFGYEWDTILISAGGNDLIDDARKIIKFADGNSADPAAYCDENILKQTMDDIVKAYKEIVALRDKQNSSCPDCRIITHMYDWTTPRNAPARFLGLKLRGPWLHSALVKAQVPMPMWERVSEYLIGRLGGTILGLEKILPSFSVANTHGTLDRAQPNTTLFSGDWADEIHPSMKGYRKLARKVAALI